MTTAPRWPYYKRRRATLTGVRITLINGSPRKNGNTADTLAILADSIVDHARAAGDAAELATIDLARLKINGCRGCRLCFDRGESACPMGDDDVEYVRNTVRESDAVVIASPTYMNDVSGLLKTLIDRLAYAAHRPEFYNVTGMALATTAASPTRHTTRTIQSAFVSWGADPTLALGLALGARTPRDSIRSTYGHRIDVAAKKLIRATRAARRGAVPFVRLLVFRIQQYAWAKEDPESVDYRYWQDKGWLDKKTSFFRPHRAGFPKRALARVVGSVIGRIFA